MRLITAVVIQTFCGVQTVRAAFSLSREYNGWNFLSGWEYQGGYDNTTNGTVLYHSILLPTAHATLRVTVPQGMSIGCQTPQTQGKTLHT